jgi:hypothetical protein
MRHPLLLRYKKLSCVRCVFEPHTVRDKKKKKYRYRNEGHTVFSDVDPKLFVLDPVKINKSLEFQIRQQVSDPNDVPMSRVVDPEPDWTRIQWGVWIRIRNRQEKEENEKI